MIRAVPSLYCILLALQLEVLKVFFMLKNKSAIKMVIILYFQTYGFFKSLGIPTLTALVSKYKFQTLEMDGWMDGRTIGHFLNIFDF